MITPLFCLLALTCAAAAPPASAAGRAPSLLTQARTHLLSGENAAALARSDEALLLAPESGWARALRCVADGGRSGITSPRDVAMSRRLVDPVITIDFHHAELSVVLSELEQCVGVAMIADWPALTALDIYPDDYVTLNATAITTAEFLDRLMRRLGDGPWPRWDARSGQVTISTPQSFRDPTHTVVYDVRPLIRADNDDALREAVKRLVDQLRDNIDPEGWRIRDGHRNWLKELNGNLIITSTPWNHRAIESTLDALRGEQARADLFPGLP